MNAAMMNGNVLEVEVHAAGNPGAGKRAQMSWTSRASSRHQRGVVAAPQRPHDERPDALHLDRAEASRRHGRRPDADARGRVRRQRVEGDRVLVDGDADVVEKPLGFLAGHAEWRHVDEEQVVVRAARHEARAGGGERPGERCRVDDRPALVLSERVGAGLEQRDGLGRDDVHERAALRAREDRLVDRGREARAAEHQAATRSAQRLVGRRRDDVGVRERARVEARGDEARDVRHVHHEQRVVRAGDLGEPLEVDDARVGAGARDDELRPDLPRLDLERAVVDALVLRRDAVGVDLVPASREVDRRAVGQVAAMGQAHAEDPVTVVEHREVRGHVRLRARVRLDVDVLGTREQRDRALLRERLDDVDELAAPVVALDSGALYRLAALAALRRGVTLTDAERVAALADSMAVTFGGPDGSVAFLDGEDVSAQLRTEEAGGAAASKVAVIPAVREALLGRQRAFARPPGLVADGRDMGTVVFPDAILKVFLTASADERAMRRHKQLKEKGIDVSLPDLSWDIAQRDTRDANRGVAPLKPAPDARIIDSTSLSPEEVIVLGF